MKYFLLLFLLIYNGVSNANEEVIFIGDSLAEGFKKSSNGRGKTRVGAQPREVQVFINSMDLRDRPVVLSTGVSNNCTDYKTVSYNISLVGNQARYFMLIDTLHCKHEVSIWLQQTCALFDNCQFYSLSKSRSNDGIHPNKYEKLTYND